MMRAILLLVLSGFLASAAMAQDTSVTLEWDANTEEDLAGYKLYYKKGGNRGASYNGTDIVEGTSPIDVGLVTTYTVTGLTNGVTYWFAVTAYDNEDPVLESGYSNVVGNYTIKRFKGIKSGSFSGVVVE